MIRQYYSHAALSLKLVAVAIFVGMLGLPLWDMSAAKMNYFFSEEKYLKAGLYIVLFVIACAGFILTFFVRSLILRGGLCIVFMAGFLIDQVSIRATGGSLSPDLAGVLLANVTMAPEVAPSFAGLVTDKIFLSIFTIAVALIPSSKVIVKARWAIVPISAMGLIVAAVYYSFATLIEFPSFYAVPAKFFEASMFRLYSGKRKEPDYRQPFGPKLKHVVLIVDESARGDHFSLNNPAIATTPYLRANRDKLVNFGVAVASWNCSIFSRIVLRTGLGPKQLPDYDQQSLKRPTFWQYAKRAGYQTVLLDGFSGKKRLHSFMNENEFSQIDKVHYAGSYPMPDRDQKLGALLLQYMGSDKPSFILVNKVGVHFPYHGSYPHGFGVFDAGPGGKPGAHSKPKHLRGAYHNGLLWSVDRFFKTYLSGMRRDDTLILYTSDHGQSFARRNKSIIGHCSVGESDPAEGLVPLIAITENKKLKRAFTESAKRAFNRMTHFQIFPTLLELMGYEKQWVESRYGNGLLSAPPRKRGFRNGSLYLDVRDKLRSARRGRWIMVDEPNVGAPNSVGQ